VLIAVWTAGIFSTKSTVRSASYTSRLIIFVPLLAGYLLEIFGVIPRHWLLVRPWPVTPSVQIAGLMLTVLGSLFAIWARLALGSNWSGLPTVRREHELIVRGPYALVRHPIYTGLLLAMAGSAVAADRSVWTIGWFLVALSYTVKIRQEERLMMETFPDQYPAYKHRTKALVPFVL
jgi:protein-S-isoprenylcysteine O-methyltransferase Ste14